MEIKFKIYIFFLIIFLNWCSFACEVPVFKYAMEFWSSDKYDIYIFNNGELKNQKDKNTFNIINEASLADYKSSQANVNLHFVDLTSNKVTAQERRLWEEQKADRQPWIAVYYPFVHGKERKVWAGYFGDVNPNFLLTSPKRQEIVKLLLEGESAVWVFLESGNKNADSRALRLLNRELMRLERTLKLPIPETWGWAGSAESIDINIGTEAAADTEISFSVLTLSRDDPAEEILLNTLLKSEKDLHKYTGQPMVFPIYGRGLILYALIGNGINEWTLNKAGEFLTGPCSCEVKAGNPGIDMLLRVNWDSRKTFAIPQEAPPLTGVSEFFSRVEKEKEIAEQLEEQEVLTIEETAEKNNDLTAITNLDTIQTLNGDNVASIKTPINLKIVLPIALVLVLAITTFFITKNKS